MKCFGMLIDGWAQVTGIRKRGDHESVLLVLNSYEGAVGFKLPEVSESKAWRLLVDTNIADGPTDEVFDFGQTYEVTGRSFLAFRLEGASPLS